jgi:hypothetical protein
VKKMMACRNHNKKGVGFRQVLALWIFIAGPMIHQPAVGQTEVKEEWVARIVSIQGQVHVRGKQVTNGRRFAWKIAFMPVM